MKASATVSCTMISLTAVQRWPLYLRRQTRGDDECASSKRGEEDGRGGESSHANEERAGSCWQESREPVAAAAYESEPATHCLAASSRSASGRMMPMSVSQMGKGVRGEGGMGAERVRLRGARVWGAAERGADLSRSDLLWLRGGGGGGAGWWAAMLGGGWAARTLALELREDLEGARARMLLDDGVAAVGAADEAEHVHQACGGGPGGVPVRGMGQVWGVPGGSRGGEGKRAR